MESAPSRPDGTRLPARTKILFASGDHTVNVVLSAASLLYLVFLTDSVGLRPALAGAVVWIARAVDAFSDPAMGRISDLTRWRAGRRRPYFLIGAIPFGVFFALMWSNPPLETDLAKFAYYSLVYIGVSLFMTCLSVPYLALIPEMATDYDERTSFNTYRSAAAVLGTFVAVTMKPISDSLGGGAPAWATAGLIMGVWLVVPWIAVYAVSFERPEFRKQAQVGFVEGARILARHRAYRSLAGFFILARIAVDLIGAMFLFYFTYWIGRAEDFGPTLFLFLTIVVLSLPFWLRFATRRDKRGIFIFGAAWWICAQIVIFLALPEWPRWSIFAITSIAAIGYAVADLMPWAMLGDVIDEDELTTGERREGIYVGFFMFLRKVGGASAVLAIGAILEFAGFSQSESEQSPQALETIRVLTSLVPMGLLLASIAVATRYPLTRGLHAQILERLATRRARGESARLPS